MKASRTFLSSVIFLTMGSPLAHAAGAITIGGTSGNVSAGPVISPVNFGLDATLSEFELVNALNANSGTDITVTNAGNPAGTGINVANGVTWTQASQLTLAAHDGIIVGANITNSVGGNLVLNANNGSVALNGVVRLIGSPTSSTLEVTATTGISQDNAHILAVDGLATFNANSSNIVLTGPLNNFGSLNLTGASVSVRESSAMNLAGVSATTLGLLADGAITQTGAIQVSGLATFNAGVNSITLADGTNNFGSLSLTGGAISVSEAGGTDLAFVSGSSLIVNSGGALANSGNVTVTGAASFSGSSINLGGGAGTVSVGSLNVNSTGNVTLHLTAGTSLTGANTAGNFVWNTQGIGTLTAGASLTADSVSIQSGSLALTGNNQIIANSATVGTGTQLNLGAFNTSVGTYNQNGTAILAGTGTLTALDYNLNGGTVNANLGTGTLNHIGGSTLLVGTSAAGTVNVGGGGILTLGSSNRLVDTANVVINGGTLAIGNATDTVGTFTLNTGNLNGTGTLTATSYFLNGGAVNANLGTGTLNQIGGNTLLHGISSAFIVNINAGTLTLDLADRLANNAAVSINSGVLDLGTLTETVGSFALNTGRLDGSGTLTAATYNLNGGIVNSNLGVGTLTHSGGNTLLNGTSASNLVSISGGTLSLGFAERLSDSAALTISGGTLDLGSLNETVATFGLNGGTLAGSGTLTAASYTLNGGSVFANLAAGPLTQTGGNTMLSGTSASTTIGITGGTLTIGSDERLNDLAAVTIGSAGTLDLANANETVATLALNGGTIIGTGGTLTAANYSLNGGLVNGNLGAGILNQLSGTTILNGTSASANINVNAGTLTIGSSDRLIDSADIIIASTGILNLGNSNDTVGNLTLNGGTINGTGGTLTATTYALNGGTVNGNLGTGTLNQLVNTTFLHGSSAAGTVNVIGGNLTLGAANRLDDNAAVTVNSAILNIAGFNDIIGSLTLNGGSVNGGGILTATTYDLNGGTVNANLGTGTLNQLSNTTYLNGSSAASIVNINGGILTLGMANRLDDNAAVTIANGATLNISTYNDIVGSLTLNGGTLDGSGTLTATAYDFNGGTLKANLGNGVITQLSNNTLLIGSSAAATVDINGGTLTLRAANRLADNAAVTINTGATLDLDTFSDTVGTFGIFGGNLNGSGTLTASTYALNGGTVNANLGAGTLSQVTGNTLLYGSSAAGIVNINGGTLTLRSAERLANSAVLTVNNGTLDLESFNETVGTFALNGGTLSGSGILTATTYGLNGGTVDANLGTGILTQIGSNTQLNGSSAAATVNVNGGILTLGAAERLADNAALTVNAAILDLDTFAETVGTFALNGGTIDGSGTLTAATYGLNGGIVNANLGAGTLNQIGNTTTLNGTSSAATVNITGGTLTLGSSNRLSDSAAVTISSLGTLNLENSDDTVGSFVLNGGVLSGTGGTLTTAIYALNGGSVSGNLGAGTLNQLSNTTVLSGTSAAGIVNVDGGTLTLSTSNRLSDGAAVSVASLGTLNLGSSNDTVASFALNGGILDGTGTLTAATYALNGGTVNANLGTGTLNQLSNSTLLNGTSAAASVNINGGILTLGAANRLDDNAAVTINTAVLDLGTFSDLVGNLTLNGGTLDGSGTLTATTYSLNGGTVNANLGTGTLNQLSNNTFLKGSSAASTVNINGGTLTLSASNRLADAANVTVNGAILDLDTYSDTVGTFTLNGGSLNGSGTLTAATYGLNGGIVNANLGVGLLTQSGGSTLLKGSSDASTVNVNSGTLTLGASNRLADTANLTVNSAILDINTFVDTVASLTLNGGTLNGSGTLSAATYGLNGGTVNANLGTGILNQLSNNTLLKGSSAAATVNVNGGSLTLGASNRLADGANVTVNTAILDLDSYNDTVGTFTLNGGSLIGTGTLTATTYGLNGGSVNANLGTGILNQLSNNTHLVGSSAAGTVNINGGTLTLDAANRLADNAAVTVNSAVLDLATFSDTVGTFALNGGTLEGTGTLTATTYGLNGGTVNAKLGTGTLNQLSNTTVLVGTSAAGIVNVNGGTLALNSSNRLADTAAVTIASAGTLDLGASNDTVGSLVLNGGNLTGGGTLTASTYGLNGGSVNANLGTGTLNQLSNTTVLNGTSAAGTVNITGGILTLGGADRLSDSAALTIGQLGTLNLGTHSDTVGSFVLNGGTLNGTGTLTATTYGLNGGIVNANLGTGTLNQISNITVLNGTSSASIVNINGGSLTLGASDRLDDSAAVTIAGILNIGNFSDTIGSLTMAGGTINGTGVLTAGSYDLNGIDVNANLGAGTLNQVSGNSFLNGTSAGTSVNVNGGTLTLGAAERLLDNAALTVNTGTLNLGTFNETVGNFTLNGGTLAGSGTLSATTYALNGGNVNANLGAGSLSQLSNTTVLNGSSAASVVEIAGGTLTLGASDRLADNANVTVASAGTFDLGTADDTVIGFTLNGGTLNGSGTLTATSAYNLNGGTVNGNLGSGTLNQLSNTTLLNGSSAALNVSITGGSLALGASNRLSDTASVALNSGSLDLATFDDTVGSFRVTGGSLDGSGTLTAATYQMDGGTVNANLGAGILNATGGLLNGKSAATTVAISGTGLTLGASERLANTATVTLTGGFDLGDFNERVSKLILNSGNLEGTGTLTAATYDLNGGQVNANLGSGTLNQLSGTTRLAGKSTASQVDIAGGVLDLMASNRLADTAAVTLGTGAVLNLRANTDTVDSFTLNGGTLQGSGTLTATTYDLNGGSVDANLGAGTLNQFAGSTNLNGKSSAGSVEITGGSLHLTAPDRLADQASVSIASTGTLDIGVSDETVGGLRLNGGTLDGTGTLTASTYRFNGGTVNANLSVGTLNQTGGSTLLNGTSAAETVTVKNGTLALGSSNRLADLAKVTIEKVGKLELGSTTDAVDSLELNGGRISGSGTLTANTYDLNGGTVAANLGRGTVNHNSFTTILSGTSAAGTVNVDGGVLTLGADERLSNSATVSVNAAKFNIDGFDDTVANLNIKGGTLLGGGTLTARTYQFRNADIFANLGEGEINQLAGVTRLKGSSDANRVNVENGVLKLIGAERLADRSTVQVVNNAKLKLRSGVETVAKYLQDDSGKLLGKGNLNVTGLAKLSGGTMAAKLKGDTVIIDDVTVTGKIEGGFIHVKKGNLDLEGILASDTKISGRGELHGTGKIAGDLRNLGDLTVGSFRKSLTVGGDLTNRGTVTLSLKNSRTFESIKADSLKFGGTLVVVNDGSGLGNNQIIQLFEAGSYKGEFNKIVTVGFKNQLVFDEKTGTLAGTGTPIKDKGSPKAKTASLMALSASTARPVEGVRVIGGRKYRTLKISRTIGVEVSLRDIQVSSDRVDWASGKRHITVLRDDAEMLVVRDNTPVNQDNKRFIRLKR